MDNALLETLTRKALTTGARPFSFIWQGGEPTLMGTPFYREALALQKKYAPDGNVENALQTNGLLIDDEWAAFLAESSFLVGISLDGPEDVHDAHRVTSGGRGTWNTVRQAARRLHGAGAMVNGLCCVSRASEGRAADIYRYFKAEGFRYLQCIPVWEVDAKGAPLPFSVSPEGYGEFLVELFDVWNADKVRDRVSIRLFDSLAAVLAGGPPPECGLLRSCGVYLTVEHEGSVYPCDFFVHKAHHLGNVLDHALPQMLNSPKQRRFGQAKSRTPDQCRNCEWITLCRSGCLKFRAFPQGTNGNNSAPEYVFCRSMVRFFNHAVPRAFRG